jgi:hypothetical protein
MEAGHLFAKPRRTQLMRPPTTRAPPRPSDGPSDGPPTTRAPAIRPRGRGAPSGPPRASSELRRDRYPRPALRGAARRRGQPGQPGGEGRPETSDSTPSRSREHARPRPRPRPRLPTRARARPSPGPSDGPTARPRRSGAPAYGPRPQTRPWARYVHARGHPAAPGAPSPGHALPGPRTLRRPANRRPVQGRRGAYYTTVPFR